MDAIDIEIHVVIGGIVVRLHHAIGTKYFYALIIAVNRLAAVVDCANGAVGKSEGDHGSIYITSFADTWVDHDSGRDIDLFHFAAAQIASHIEVVDRHIEEHAARNFDIRDRRGSGVATGNSNDVRVTDFAFRNHLTDFTEVRV